MGITRGRIIAWVQSIKLAHHVNHLRKLGIPLEWNHQPIRGESATYDFCSMMELAVALR